MDKEPLDYATPVPGPKPETNRWWKVILRMAAGTIAGVGACVLGVWLGNATGIALLMVLPFLVLFSVAVYISVTQRRYGYTAGIILAPFLTAAAICVLLIIICGTMRI